MLVGWLADRQAGRQNTDKFSKFAIHKNLAKLQHYYSNMNVFSLEFFGISLLGWLLE